MRTSLVCSFVFAALAFGAATASAQDKGATVYAAQKCNMCHSLDGKGPGKNVLDGVGGKLKADDIRQWIVTPADMAKKANSTAKPPMRAYPNLAKEDLDALVAFLAAKK
jgi:mono/diheme cytochrome c family protein